MKAQILCMDEVVRIALIYVWDLDLLLVRRTGAVSNVEVVSGAG